jgi:cytidylate kinase
MLAPKVLRQPHNNLAQSRGLNQVHHVGNETDGLGLQHAEAIMAVITVTREMGTLGKDVVQGLAGALKCDVVHHELVEHDLAAQLGMQESAVHRYLEGDATLFERWKIDKQKLSRFTALEILKLAKKGNVIIRGWGASALLKDVPHVLRVRICAPQEFREKVMMRRLNVHDVNLARREIERSDAAHGRIVHGFFGLDWKNPLLYNIVLNTAAVPIPTCVTTLTRLADDPVFQETAESRIALNDKLLEWQIRNVLIGRELVNFGGSSVDVDVSAGAVVLTGSCYAVELKDAITRLVREMPGVTSVEDRIYVVGQSHFM